MGSQSVRIGTRASPLALAQAGEVRDRLVERGLDPDACEIVVMSTAGDRITDRPLTEIGGKGLFTQEIEAGLRDGRLDMAVHSSKDIPAELPEEMELAAFLERADPRDVFVGGAATTLQDLPAGAVVGTSSPRRQALVRWIRPDLDVAPLRGSVQTRLKKVREGQVDGTLLAYAGLKRLGMEEAATQILDPDPFLPAIGQGAICVEARRGDERVAELLSRIDHRPTHAALSCERAFLKVLEGSCRTPIAGLATLDGSRLRFRGMALSFDGGERHAVEGEGAAEAAAKIGREAGEKLLRQAGPEFLRDWR